MKVDSNVSSDIDYFKVLDAVSTPIMLHRAGNIIYGNAAFQKMVGFATPQEMLSAPYYEIGYGEWHDILRRRGDARMQDEKPVPVYEFRLNTRDGRECWVELTASKIMLGEYPTIFCSFVDLTDRKRAEIAQRNLRQLLAEIIDRDPVATFVVDAQHRVTHWNRAMAILTRSPPEEMVGTDAQWKAFYPGPRDTMADMLLRQPSLQEMAAHYPDATIRVSEVDPEAFEGERLVTLIARDEQRWLFFTAAVLRDSEGNIFGAVEKIQDVTDKRIALESLREHQTQLQKLVDERTAELAEANARLQEDINRREAAELELRRRNVELLLLNAKISQAQNQLMQAEKLASIGQLAAGVAHEINNPIGYVQSNLGTLDKYLGSLFRLLAAYESHAAAVLAAGESGELADLCAQIDINYLREDIPLLISESREGVARVSKIVQDLKDFSRADSAQEWQMADVHQCIDSAINIATNEIKYKADVIREYGDLPKIECIPMQLNQVFLNLLVNAAQAIGDKRGLIAIRTGANDAEQVWLEFEDNGQGMSEEVKSKAFDPFFTTKPVGKGTGLGLSMSYGIIQKHGGNISFDSTPGVGTIFRITLPVAQPKDTKEVDHRP
ncbi:MAG: Sensor protein ZraS [Betaproteobacteria bacterium ADurb.Bin341]|nr:MAG: Sensor protein ZraS [Betaproteobacteria bacterium ADurb.Bin341]